ncbi:MAG TPA: fumarylacetoacetate hydrolase family protein, partial [Solirubrobacteraceae bacterium]
MRLATVITPEGLRLHVRGSDGYIDVAQATGDQELASLSTVLVRGAGAFDAIRKASEGAGRVLEEGEIAPAVPSPPRILCLGVNYVEHALEGGRPPTKWPEVFVRGADSVAAPYGALVKPSLSSRFDYEGELGLVIGRGGRYISADEALSAIAGYVIVMDGTAREWQRAATQWTPGKNFDGTMPIGPELVTTDEIDVSDV